MKYNCVVAIGLNDNTWYSCTVSFSVLFEGERIPLDSEIRTKAEEQVIKDLGETDVIVSFVTTIHIGE